MRKRQAKKIYKTNLEGYRQQSVTKALQKCPLFRGRHTPLSDLIWFVRRIRFTDLIPAPAPRLRKR